MEDETKKWAKAPKLSSKSATKEGYLVHIYPMGPAMGKRYQLGDTSLLLGRDDQCHILIEDESVSRRHACIQALADGYHILDLRSTNGTYVNKVRILDSKLKDGDYLRIGNCIYRFLAGGNVEAEYHEELVRLSVIDALTEVHNKRYLLDFLGRELALAARYQRPMALVLFDVDRFKAINEAVGHLGGDYVLRELAALVKSGIRKTDLLARFGGEEFAIVMPETSRLDALEIAERVRRMLEEQPFQYESQQISVTISLGITAVTGGEWLTSSELLQRADEKLLLAKREGRNCLRA